MELSPCLTLSSLTKVRTPMSLATRAASCARCSLSLFGSVLAAGAPSTRVMATRDMLTLIASAHNTTGKRRLDFTI
jgi:hypothetical protein